MKRLHMRKELAPAMGLLASVTAFGIVALGAPVVMGSPATDETDAHPAVIDRVVVASGESSYFGRWELVTARDTKGQPCVGVRLIRDPADGGTSISEGCGDATANQVGTITAAPGKKGTFFFGRVDDAAVAAKVFDDGTEQVRIQTLRGRDGRTYVAGETSARLPEADVRLSDRGARDLGRVDPAAVAE